MDMRKLNGTRRRFLKGLASAGLGLAASPILERAASAQMAERDLYFVFCYFGGGWDTLVSIDPRDPRRFSNGNIRQTLIEPGYERLPGNRGMIVRTSNGDYGPYFGDMVDHADKLCVVRGLSMETLGHSSGRRRFLTGRPPSGNLARGSSGATWLASKLGTNDTIPNVAIGLESYNVDQPSYATALSAGGVQDLLRSLAPSEHRLLPSERTRVEALLQGAADCDSSKFSPTLKGAELARLAARSMSDGTLYSRFDLLAENEQMEAIRGHYGIPNDPGALDSGRSRLALASAAITGGVSRVVSATVAGGLDTHSNWANTQGPRQVAGWNAIARLVEDLEGKQFKDTGDTWLDHTVIMAFSEFSRTPLINGRDGRDHHITNSCLLVGGGLRPGIYGASTDVGMSPGKTNPATGMPDMDGVVMKPEHVLRSLMVKIGFTEDVADFRADPIMPLIA